MGNYTTNVCYCYVMRYYIILYNYEFINSRKECTLLYTPVVAIAMYYMNEFSL